MSKLLGVIKAIIGQVYVVDANGAQRQVHEGDRVYSGEEIVTGVSGAVSISLPDGKTLDIGRNSHWGEHGLRASHNPESSAQDIAAAQKAIADGADPTQVLDVRVLPLREALRLLTYGSTRAILREVDRRLGDVRPRPKNF